MRLSKVKQIRNGTKCINNNKYWIGIRGNIYKTSYMSILEFIAIDGRVAHFACKSIYAFNINYLVKSHLKKQGKLL